MANIIDRKHQQGAAAIEFAAVFVLFFVLFYAVVGYMLPLLLAATYEEVAADALREAVRHPDVLVATPQIQSAQRQKVREAIDLLKLPPSWKSVCADRSDYLTIVGNLWSVCLRHPDPRSILPPISLLGIDVPQLPDEIRGEASLRIR